MKKVLALIALMMMTTSMALAGEYSGYLSDKKCAKAAAGHANCAKGCVKGGQPVVLVEEGEGGKVYDIANADAVTDHIGHKVTITGKLDGTKLEVEKVKM
jgi:threonine synthase